MKTKKTRRSLLWGVLLAGFAGTLTVATHPVRAEGITSSAIAAATGDASTVKPYFWSEIAHAVTALIGGSSGPIGLDVKGDGWAPTYIEIAGGVNQQALRAVPARALD